MQTTTEKSREYYAAQNAKEALTRFMETGESSTSDDRHLYQVALSLLRASHHARIENSARHIQEAIKEGQDPQEALFGEVDRACIYHADNYHTLMGTENEEAFFDLYGDLGETDNTSTVVDRIAAAAYQQDLQEHLDREHPEWDNQE